LRLVSKQPSASVLGEFAAQTHSQKLSSALLLSSVVSVGGGMATNTAKGIAVMLSSPGKPGDYLQNCDPDEQLNVTLVQGQAAPHVAIPTAVDSGEVCTNMAQLIDGKLADTLMPMVGASLYPHTVIVDPDLFKMSGPGLLRSGSNAQELTARAMLWLVQALEVLASASTGGTRTLHPLLDEAEHSDKIALAAKIALSSTVAASRVLRYLRHRKSISAIDSLAADTSPAAANAAADFALCSAQSGLLTTMCGLTNSQVVGLAGSGLRPDLQVGACLIHAVTLACLWWRACNHVQCPLTCVLQCRVTAALAPFALKALLETHESHHQQVLDGAAGAIQGLVGIEATNRGDGSIIGRTLDALNR
jgi:hypothetical protein